MNRNKKPCGGVGK